jgi:hypothetical protein
LWIFLGAFFLHLLSVAGLRMDEIENNYISNDTTPLTLPFPLPRDHKVNEQKHPIERE